MAKKPKNKEKRLLHGNNAKIDPKTEVTSLYQSNRVTLSSRREDETPLVDDDNVEYARRFSEENKK